MALVPWISAKRGLLEKSNGLEPDEGRACAAVNSDKITNRGYQKPLAIVKSLVGCPQQIT